MVVDSSTFLKPAEDNWKEKMLSAMETADGLDPLILCIAFTFKPTKIFMLRRKYFNNKHSRKIDLLIMMGNEVPFKERTPLLKLTTMVDERAQCTFHNEDEVLKKIHKGALFIASTVPVKT